MVRDVVTYNLWQTITLVVGKWLVPINVGKAEIKKNRQS
jgi:hypothetical protein